MTGHIKLDRKILTWEWYDDINTCRVFIHLLLMATHKDGRYRGMEIKRGEVVTGRLKLSRDVGLSENEVRRTLDKLKTTNEITIKTTNKFSIITICKYDVYQSSKNENNQQNNQPIDQQSTNNQPTINQQLTTFNNVNNVNNVNNADATKIIDMDYTIRVWKKDCSQFLNDEMWKINFCSTKHIDMKDLEYSMNAFVVRLNLQEDYKNVGGLKKHYTNHYNKHGLVISEMEEKKKASQPKIKL